MGHWERPRYRFAGLSHTQHWLNTTSTGLCSSRQQRPQILVAPSNRRPCHWTATIMRDKRNVGLNSVKIVYFKTTVPFRSIRQGMLRVTCLPKFLFRHLVGPLHFLFSGIFWAFLGLFLAFFPPFPIGFGTSLEWPLHALHIGNFGRTVTRYCRIDRNVLQVALWP